LGKPRQKDASGNNGVVKAQKVSKSSNKDLLRNSITLEQQKKVAEYLVRLQRQMKQNENQHQKQIPIRPNRRSVDTSKKANHIPGIAMAAPLVLGLVWRRIDLAI